MWQRKRGKLRVYGLRAVCKLSSVPVCFVRPWVPPFLYTILNFPVGKIRTQGWVGGCFEELFVEQSSAGTLLGAWQSNVRVSLLDGFLFLWSVSAVIWPRMRLTKTCDWLNPLLKPPSYFTTFFYLVASLVGIRGYACRIVLWVAALDCGSFSLTVC